VESLCLLAQRKCLAGDFQAILSSKMNLTLLRENNNNNNKTLNFETNSLSGALNSQSKVGRGNGGD
jgi:hypothetical protein